MSINNQVTHNVSTTGSNSSGPIQPKKGNLVGKLAMLIDNKVLDLAEQAANSAASVALENHASSQSISLALAIVLRGVKVIAKARLDEARIKTNMFRIKNHYAIQSAFKNTKPFKSQPFSRSGMTIQEWDKKYGEFNKIKKEAERTMQLLRNNI